MKMVHACKSCAVLAASVVLMAFGTAMATPSQIDILVAYDQTATKWFEGKGVSYSEFASSQVKKINDVLENSKLGGELVFRLVGVHIGAFSYTSTPNIDAVLDTALQSNDAAWTKLRADRDTVGADIVMILVDTGKSIGQMGTSFALRPVVNGERQWGVDFAGADQYFSQYYSELAYGVCDITAVQDGYTMVHETGHILGAGHSETLNPAYSEPGPQLFTYSKALMYKGSNGNYYSTVMGYNSTGYDSNLYEVLPCFSSPDVVNPDTGEPLGDAEHDNVRTIRATYKLVEKFRTSSTSVAPTPTSAAPTEVFKSKTVCNGVLKQGIDVVGIIQLTVAKTTKGFSKVSGSVIGLDGKKRNIKGNKYKVFNANGVAFVSVESATIKDFSNALTVTLGSDGSIVAGSIGDITVESAEIGALASQRLVFEIGTSLTSATGMDFIESVDYNDRQYATLPYAGDGEQIMAVNDKWTVAAKAGKLKFKDGVLSVDLGKDGSKTNLSALKLSFKKKTGTFKGSFTAYVLVDSKLKKFKFDVTGLVVNGTASGIATCKKLGTPVTIPVSVRAAN